MRDLARQRQGETDRDAVAGETSLPPALRQRCLDHVQSIASVKSKPDRDSGEVEAAVEALEAELAAAFPARADELAHLIWDMDWTPPRKATNRYQAGAWLNMLIAAWREYAGGLAAIEGYSTGKPGGRAA